MYYNSRIRRMVWYGLSDAEIAKSLEISIAEVRATVSQMDPAPFQVLDENAKVIQERFYLKEAVS